MYTADADFGARLRKARRDRGMSQTDASEGIVTASFLSLIESGKRVPSPKVAAALASRVGIAVDASLTTPDTADPDFVAALAAVQAGDIDVAAARATQLSDAGAGRSLIAGLIAEHRGALTDAVRNLQSALAAEKVGSEMWFEIASALCRCAFNAGDVPAAMEVGEAALAISEPVTPRCEDLGIAIRSSLSGIYLETGNVARARSLAEDPAVEPRTAWQRGTQLWAQSMLAAAEGQAERAEMLASEALQQFRSSDRPTSLARLQVNAAVLKLQSPNADLTEVDALLTQAELTFRTLQVPFDLAGCLTARAGLAVAQQHTDEARDAVAEAVRLVHAEGAGLRARIYASAGLTLLSLGDRESAEAHMRTARELLEDVGVNRAAASTWRQLASAYESLGQLDLALACMKAATDLLGVQPMTSAGHATV